MEETSSTKQFCDIILGEDSYTEDDDMSCSDCMLGSWKTECIARNTLPTSAHRLQVARLRLMTLSHRPLIPSVHRHVLQRRPWRPILINQLISYATMAKKKKVSTNRVVSLNSLGQKCEDLRQGRTICPLDRCFA